jgi:hypothetical protein
MSRRKSPTSNYVSKLFAIYVLPLLTILCSLKHLIPVQFSFHTSSVSSLSADSTPAQGSSTEKKEDQRDPMCPSCKKELNNNVIMHGAYTKCLVSGLMAAIDFLPSVMKPCAHVTCKTCTDSLVRPAKQCVVCDTKLSEKDILELKREGARAISLCYCIYLQFAVKELGLLVAAWPKLRRKVLLSRDDIFDVGLCLPSLIYC